MKLVTSTDFRKEVKKRLTDLGKTMAELQRDTGITKSTLQSRLNHPGDITLEEFKLISAALHFNDEEKLKCINGILR